MRTFRLMNGEEVADLTQNGFKITGFVVIAGFDCVAVHRIRTPDHFAAFTLHPTHQRRQLVGQLVGAHPGDQGQATWNIVRIQRVD